MVRIPKPAYVFSRLSPGQRPDAELYQVLIHLAELYQLGEIRACRRVQQSTSLNFVVTTPRDKFVFRQHRLSEDQVEYEHQVLEHLKRRDFPAPRMLVNQAGQAWCAIDGSLYSVYEFMEGYFLSDFLWWPAGRRDMIVQCGRTLGKYHQAVADLVPSAYKWNGYRPGEHRRWRGGDWFRQAVAEIRPFLQKPTATSPIDDWTRSRIDAIDQMLDLEPAVEGRSDLSKVVIHGDYAPWNILFRPGQFPAVLDFNESRLDLKIYDVVLATFWFAWRGHRPDQERVRAFQSGYCETGQLCEIDTSLAGSVFRWIMARSIIERLYKQYPGPRPVLKRPASLERQYQMCVFAKQHPQQLLAGLKGNTG